MNKEEYKAKYPKSDWGTEYSDYGIDLIFGDAGILLDEDSPNLLMAGQAGSGKSCAVNRALATLITSYKPDMLDIRYIDAKNTEIGMFVEDGVSIIPHATLMHGKPTPAFVIEELKKLLTIAEERTALFEQARIGSLGDYNEMLRESGEQELCNVLPRILFLLDEFQAPIYEGTPEELAEIVSILLALKDVGRTTGIHLWFASQSLDYLPLEQVGDCFDKRIALRCTKEVSLTILGNTAASELTKKYGQLITNHYGGSETFNSTVNVEFIDYISLKKIIKETAELYKEQGCMYHAVPFTESTD